MRRARSVDESKCTGCGICIEKCPWKAPNKFEQGLKERKAIYVPYAQAIPNIPVIDRETCTYFKNGKCKACQKFCGQDAIDFTMTDKEIKLNVGSVILTPGYEAFDAKLKGEYGYGRYPNVVTSLEFERILSASGPYQGKVLRPSDKQHPHKIAWIQCVGSRDTSIGNGYCSVVCCMYAVKEAVIAAMHDLNLAALYFDRLIVLKEGQVVADGTPSQVLSEKMISEVFGATVKVEVHPTAGVPHIIVMPKGQS